MSFSSEEENKDRDSLVPKKFRKTKEVQVQIRGDYVIKNIIRKMRKFYKEKLKEHSNYLVRSRYNHNETFYEECIDKMVKTYLAPELCTIFENEFKVN